jgi:ubiquinone/menaquinone biosynthesis C-methylase UbiE
MGFYAERVFTPVMNRVMNTKETRRIRAEVCAPLAGEVLEIGFGTGHNLPFLPPAVTRLLAVDPLERGRVKAAKRLAASTVPVTFVGLDGQSLPLPDDSADMALATWTLCSIPDPVAAVREVARVLRPGGTFHFVEHGRAPADDVKVRKWQDRLDPLQQRMACGCHLARDIPSIVTDGGMVIDRLETFYAESEPKPFSWTFQGVAHAD